jgi:lipoprotein-anchoring transpeptidase ErfK/SrfK
MRPAERIDVDVAAQRLTLRVPGQPPRVYPVSTALAGAGELNGSMRTPRGLHVVRAKIGSGLPPGAVLVGRRPTGEIWSPALGEAHPGRDWILSRVLWLSGLEPGRNRLGEVDTMRRYIYIHGTPEEDSLGQARSHGCIRMSNTDVIDLFDRVPPGTEVLIHQGGEGGSP